jgi:membrane peptidoglycan carboxypeptidase
VNTVYVALNSEIGPENTLDVATRAGIPEDTGGLDANLSNVLGASSPHPIDMATAYSTIASGGTYHQWYVVKQIRNTNGPLYTHPETGGQLAINSDVVADTTYAMQQVVRSGTGSYARSLYNSHPLAGKTGTSDDNQSAWFVGFTPQLSTAVAMYKIDTEAPYGPVPLEGMKGFSDSGMTGGGLPVRVWTEYMTAALDGQPREELPDPAYGGVLVNPEPTTTTPTVPTFPTFPTETRTRPTWPPTPPQPPTTTTTPPTTTTTVPAGEQARDAGG